jgi:serine/threonine kinase 19
MSKRRKIESKIVPSFQPSPSSSTSSTSTSSTTPTINTDTMTNNGKTNETSYSDDDDEDAAATEALRRATQISDTHAAIRLLLSHFPAEVGLSPFPVILKHQIYTVVTDRSNVDKELDQLVQEQVVRCFDSATGINECFVCLNSDYVEYIKQWAHDHQDNPLIQSFCKFTILSKSVDITRGDLEIVLKDSNINDLIRTLTSNGFLTMQTQRLNIECYLFSIPSIGRVVQNILNGRKEILAILKRKKFHEMLQSKLLAVQLKKSCMRTSSVVRDLVGNDTLISTSTTSGPLIRWVKRKR